MSLMKKHVEKAHLDQAYECPSCNVLLSNFDLLDKHMQEHRMPSNDDKKLTNKKAPSPTDINSVPETTQQKSTLLRMLYKCSKCAFMSRLRNSVVEHKKTVHRTIVPSTVISEKPRALVTETTDSESPISTTNAPVVTPALLSGNALLTLFHKEAPRKEEASKATEKKLNVEEMSAEETIRFIFADK